MSKRTLPLVGVAFVCSCSLLYGVDAPRRSLGGDDLFEVDPLCIDVPLSEDALVNVPRVVTMKGSRGESGLGAEGVPVSVRLGCCDQNCPASGPPGVDAGAAGGPPGGAGGDGGAYGSQEGPAPPSAASCIGPGAEALSRAEQDAFELTAVRGCRQVSRSHLECTLDPSGEASFGVLGRATGSVAGMVGFLPVCVRPLVLPIPQGSVTNGHIREPLIVPRSGTALVAVAAVPLDDGPLSQPAPPDLAACESILSCDKAERRARFQVGFVSADIPPGQVRRTDFRAVNRNVRLSAQLTVLESGPGDEPFLSPTSDCAKSSPEGGEGGAGEGEGGGGNDEDAGTIEGLTIAAGELSTSVFYLCANGSAGNYEITPRLEEPDPVAFVAYRAAAAVPAWTQGYTVEPVGSTNVLVATSCGGGTAPAAPSAIASIADPLSVSSDGAIVEVRCDPESGAGGGAVGAGGTAGAAGTGGNGSGGAGGGGATAAACESTTLHLVPEGSCELKK